MNFIKQILQKNYHYNYGIIKGIQDYAQVSKQHQYNFQGYIGLSVMILGFSLVTTYFALICRMMFVPGYVRATLDILLNIMTWFGAPLSQNGVAAFSIFVGFVILEQVVVFLWMLQEDLDHWATGGRTKQSKSPVLIRIWVYVSCISAFGIYVSSLLATLWVIGTDSSLSVLLLPEWEYWLFGLVGFVFLVCHSILYRYNRGKKTAKYLHFAMSFVIILSDIGLFMGILLFSMPCGSGWVIGANSLLGSTVVLAYPYIESIIRRVFKWYVSLPFISRALAGSHSESAKQSDGVIFAAQLQVVAFSKLTVAFLLAALLPEHTLWALSYDTALCFALVSGILWSWAALRLLKWAAVRTLTPGKPFCVLPVEPLLIYELVGRGALSVLRSAYLRYVMAIRQAQRCTSKSQQRCETIVKLALGSEKWLPGTLHFWAIIGAMANPGYGLSIHWLQWTNKFNILLDYERDSITGVAYLSSKAMITKTVGSVSGASLAGFATITLSAGLIFEHEYGAPAKAAGACRGFEVQKEAVQKACRDDPIIQGHINAIHRDHSRIKQSGFEVFSLRGLLGSNNFVLKAKIANRVNIIAERLKELNPDFELMPLRVYERGVDASVFNAGAEYNSKYIPIPGVPGPSQQDFAEKLNPLGPALEKLNDIVSS